MACSLPPQYTIAQSILQSEGDIDGVIRVVRPMIILPNTDDSQMKFPTPNISFFLSTGSSNNGILDRRFPGSWFPTPGIATEEINDLYREMTGIYKNKGESKELELLYLGKIIKGSDLTNGRNELFNINEWAAEMLRDYCKTIVPTFDYTSVTALSVEIKSLSEEAAKALLRNYEMINEFLKDMVYIINSYFLTSWQLAVSAILGNGIWNKYPGFCLFVKEMVGERLTHAEEYLETFSREDVDRVPKTDAEVVAFLKSNCAQMTTIYNPEFKNHGSRYRKDICTFSQRYDMAVRTISLARKYQDKALKNGNSFLPAPPPPTQVFVPEPVFEQPVFVPEPVFEQPVFEQSVFEQPVVPRPKRHISPKKHNTRKRANMNAGKTMRKKRKQSRKRKPSRKRRTR